MTKLSKNEMLAGLKSAVENFDDIWGDTHEEPTKKFDVNSVDSGHITSDRELISDWVVRGMATIGGKSRDGRLWASDAGLCEKRAVVSATNPGRLVVATATNNAYFAMGNTIETLVTDALDVKGKLLCKEYKLPDIGLNLGGYIDGIVLIGGKVRVLEIKSCGIMPSKPKPTHAAQAAVYSAVTGFPATVLYFSRHVAKFDGKLIIREFELEESGVRKREIVFRMAYAKFAIDMGVVPSKPLSMLTKSMCGYCSLVSNCWGDDAVDSLLPTVSPKQHLELLELATEFVDNFLLPKNVKSRRDETIQFIEDNTPRALWLTVAKARKLGKL